MIRCLPALLLFICVADGQSLPVREWKIATWNLQNYLVQNRFEAGKFLFAYPMPEERKKRIRDVILTEKPDLLFLQEIGNAGFLRELQMDLNACGLDYPFSQFSGFDDARSGLAWLSRFSPSECIFHDLDMRRGAQELRFQGNAGHVRFFHVHLKSRFSEDPDDPQSVSQRTREIRGIADALRAFVSADPFSRFFLAGDFNTPFDDPLLDPLSAFWQPMPAADSTGSPFTYFHHSGSAEVIDGFWMLRSQFASCATARILPLPDDCPSDHRLVIFDLPPPP